MELNDDIWTDCVSELEEVGIEKGDSSVDCEPNSCVVDVRNTERIVSDVVTSKKFDNMVKKGTIKKCNINVTTLPVKLKSESRFGAIFLWIVICCNLFKNKLINDI